MPTAMPWEPLASRLGNAAGSTIGSCVCAVVGGPEIDGVFVDAFEQQPRHLGQPRFGVAHGGGVIAVDIAEIALPVDQRIARGEILRQPHQRIVDRLIAMRMEIAHHVADDLGGFLQRLPGIEPQQQHPVENAAVDRLDPGQAFKKSAKVVGDVMGNFHPHGDQAIYDALVRLAQDFASALSAGRRAGQFRQHRRR